MEPDGEAAAFSLLGGRLALRQPVRGYRVAIDPVLLAAAVPAGPGARVLDVGCGIGAAALCLAARVPGSVVTGVDAEPEALALAVENARANGFHDRVNFMPCDVGDGVPVALARRFTNVISNPPYLPAARADLRSTQARRATVESVPLAAWVAFMAGCAASNGSLTMIQRADRLDEVLAAMAAVGGGLRVIPLWPRAGMAAKRVIVTATLGSRAPTMLDAGLVLHAPDGSYTERAKEILVGGCAMLV